MKRNEESIMKNSKLLKVIPHSLVVLGFGLFSQNISADQVILDDLIVVGSNCVGQDCVNGESFGFDTIRLKENNLRIKAQDTSTSASFPTNDWQITFNDSANGGQNKFSIDDIDGGRTPFTIEASAPSHSLYVDDGGRIGLGTATPVVQLHQKDGNTPTLRLEQDGSSGFAAQIWDVASNETNFFIRDATNGSTLPFRIRPGAPTSSIDIFPDKINIGKTNQQDIGIGTTTPTTALHLKRDGAVLRVEDTTASVDIRNLMEMSNNGAVGFSIEDRDQAVIWDFRTTSTGNFIINDVGDGAEVTILRNGNMTVQGNVVANSIALTSSRSAKTDIVPVKPTEVMEKLKKMEVAEWRYKKSEKNDRHISPMAEDFYSLFQFGPSKKHINPNDLASVAIIAAQELQKKAEVVNSETQVLKSDTQELKSRAMISESKTKKLEAENFALKKRLLALERLVTNLASSDKALTDTGQKVALNQ